MRDSKQVLFTGDFFNLTLFHGNFSKFSKVLPVSTVGSVKPLSIRARDAAGGPVRQFILVPQCGQ